MLSALSMRKIEEEGIDKELEITHISILPVLVLTARCVLNVIVNVNAAVVKEMVGDATEEAVNSAEKLF